MAIAFDNAASISSAANVASLTTAAWTIAGSDRILMGGIMSGSGAPEDPASMKWGGSGGTALTKQGATIAVGSFVKVSQYSLVAPTAESNTLYGSWAGNEDETAIGGASYTGVDQSTPHGTQATATGSGTTPITATVNVTSATDELVSDVVAYLHTNGSITGIAVGASQTSRVEIDNVGAIPYEAFGMSEEAGGATVTMSWVCSGPASTCEWGILGIPLKPATGGGGRTTKNTRAWELGVNVGMGHRMQA